MSPIFCGEEDKFLLMCLFLDPVFMEYYDNRKDFSIPEFSCITESMFNIAMSYLSRDNYSCTCEGCKVSSLVNMRHQILKNFCYPGSVNLISVNTL